MLMLKPSSSPFRFALPSARLDLPHSCRVATRIHSDRQLGVKGDSYTKDILNSVQRRGFTIVPATPSRHGESNPGSC
ncbi:hypothetical protein CYMTET_24746 [Cymbomonas tetramitiformis]|uniref:Uncharacterized protein n=1 Tax=Cymbomonas tetramitiformis TaxID=36881 RepID=A0AAE0FWQ2_9CHLO|nr:hypothetical protein CYMTET_24746 [Cymbomonas tetramitiformis]